jgi:hypothetical protein
MPRTHASLARILRSPYLFFLTLVSSSSTANEEGAEVFVVVWVELLFVGCRERKGGHVRSATITTTGPSSHSQTDTSSHVRVLQ